MYHTCPICQQDNLVEMDQALIRSSDEIVCENEGYSHLRRGRLNILVHTQANIIEEQAVSSQLAYA